MFGQPGSLAEMTWLEPVAALLMLANVILVARRSLWNYGFGIAAVGLFFFVFLESQLYAAAGLQLLFLGLNLYGLMTWRAAAADAGEVLVERMAGGQLAVTLALVAALAAGIGLLLRTTDAVLPYWDSANTAVALAAQYWQARRKLESWALWVLVNVGSAGLYATQGLWFTAATYGLLFFVALWGWREWRSAA